MRTLSKQFLVGLIIITLGVSTATAQDSENRIPAGSPVKLHDITLSAGGHYSIEEGSNKGVIIGVSYEYRLDRLLGIGGSLDYVGGDFNKYVFALPIYFHPYAGWEFRVAPAVEIEREEWFLGANLGVSYEFELNEQWALLPDVELTSTTENTFFSCTLSLTFRF